MDNYYDYTWEEIIDYCKHNTGIFMPFSPITIETVNVRKINDSYYIEGYDWDLKDRIESKISTLKRSPSSFLFSYDCVNKGTLHTIELLDNAKDDEERFAIYLYAFTNELLEYRMQFKTRKIVYNVHSEARKYLTDKVFFWHHKMTRLVPEIYFSHYYFDAVNLESFEPIVEMALINARLIDNDYKAVRYITKEE